MADQESKAQEFADVLERAARAEERARILGEQLATAQAKPAAAPAAVEAPLTRVQLDTAVSDGSITQDTADEYLRKQNREEDRVSVREEIRAELQADGLNAKITSQVRAYKTARPSLDEEGSDDWKAANSEYVHLTETLGMPANSATQVAACRNVFGPVEFLGSVGAEGRHEPSRESHGGSGGGRDASSSEKIPSAIKSNPKTLAHYTRMIDKGLYPGGWQDKDLLAETKYMN